MSLTGFVALFGEAGEVVPLRIAPRVAHNSAASRASAAARKVGDVVARWAIAQHMRPELYRIAKHGADLRVPHEPQSPNKAPEPTSTRPLCVRFHIRGFVLVAHL